MGYLRDYIDGQFADDEKEEVGIGGFTMVARIRDRVMRTASIPTAYLEDGSHVNDHIIRDPLMLSIEGNVSDLHLRPSPALAAIREAEATVGLITQYGPARTSTQISKVSGLVADVGSAIDRVDAALATIDRVGEAVGLRDESASKSNIEKFLDTMDGIYESGILINVDMPFRTYERMALTSMEITRDNQQNALAFNLEFQQFRFVETQFVTAAPNPARGTGGQTAGESDKGAQEGEEVERSALTYLFGNPFQ